MMNNQEYYKNGKAFEKDEENNTFAENGDSGAYYGGGYNHNHEGHNKNYKNVHDTVYNPYYSEEELDTKNENQIPLNNKNFESDENKFAPSTKQFKSNENKFAANKQQFKEDDGVRGTYQEEQVKKPVEKPVKKPVEKPKQEKKSSDRQTNVTNPTNQETKPTNKKTNQETKTTNQETKTTNQETKPKNQKTKMTGVPVVGEPSVPNGTLGDTTQNTTDKNKLLTWANGLKAFAVASLGGLGLKLATDDKKNDDDNSTNDDLDSLTTEGAEKQDTKKSDKKIKSTKGSDASTPKQVK